MNYDSIRSIFSRLDIFLIANSFLKASDLDFAGADQTSSTGLRDLVYLAPAPELCSSTRLFMPVVEPQ